MLDLAEDPNFSDAQIREKAADIAGRLEATTRRIETVAAASAHARMLDELQRKLFDVEGREEMTLREEFETVQARRYELQDLLRERFDSMSVADQRALVSSVCTSIVVHPGRGAERVKIETVIDQKLAIAN